MLLKDMYLKRYKRLYVTSIQEVKYKPEKPIQVILGLNGSGKSSLLKEVIPNVDNVKDEYDKGGFKKLTIEHRGNEYILSYDRDSNKHSFIKNGTELNDGGLQKIQKQLIEQEFNLFKEINEILLATNSFTSMSVGERKKWFTNILSDIDYNYAMSVYNKAKDRVKELQSYIKLLKSKMIELSDLMDKPEDYEENIKRDISSLEKYVDVMLHYKSNYTEVDIRNFLDKINNLVEIGEKHLAIIESYSELLNIKPNKVDEVITKLETEKELLNKQKDSISEKLDKASKLQIDENDNLTDINKQIKQHETEINKIRKMLPDEIDIEQLPVLQQELDRIYLDMVDLLTELSDSKYTSVKIDKDKYLSSKNRLNDLTLLDRKLSTKIALLEDKIKHLEELKNSKKTICPKCGYSWIEGYSDKEHENYKKEIEKLSKELSDVKKEVEQIEQYLSTVDEKIELLKQLKSLNNTLIKPIFDYITKDTMVANNPNLVMNRLMEIKQLVDYGESVKHHMDELEDLHYRRSILEKLNSSKVKEYMDKIKELNDEYSKIVKRINELNELLEKMSKFKKHIDAVKKLTTELESMLLDYNNIKKQSVQKLQNEFINKVVLATKELITELETSLTKFKQVKENYDKLNNEIKDYENRLKVVKKIVEWLSPNKGLIGKTAVSTINEVLENMNYLINKIWSYEIKILPCNLEENDLTFRFPVLINGTKEIPDVSKGSSSIREIIDLAFKITVMEYLDMLDYPLILDEFGRTLDPTHRIKAYDFIEEISKNYFSQIYLVSHFESMYSRFTDVDVIVMSEENLTVDGKYNEVIELK